jgi:hypothetical protein
MTARYRALSNASLYKEHCIIIHIDAVEFSGETQVWKLP